MIAGIQPVADLLRFRTRIARNTDPVVPGLIIVDGRLAGRAGTDEALASLFWNDESGHENAP